MALRERRIAFTCPERDDQITAVAQKAPRRPPTRCGECAAHYRAEIVMADTALWQRTDLQGAPERVDDPEAGTDQ